MGGAGPRGVLGNGDAGRCTGLRATSVGRSSASGPSLDGTLPEPIGGRVAAWGSSFEGVGLEGVGLEGAGLEGAGGRGVASGAWAGAAIPGTGLLGRSKAVPRRLSASSTR